MILFLTEKIIKNRIIQHNNQENKREKEATHRTCQKDTLQVRVIPNRPQKKRTTQILEFLENNHLKDVIWSLMKKKFTSNTSVFTALVLKYDILL